MDCNHNVRGIFCNRTLNLNAIRAIGYDMDYTIVQYHTNILEQRAYSYIKEALRPAGWPLDDLVFDPDLAIRGLMIDTEQGNIVKANRFGYIKRAFHGTRPLEFEELRKVYQRTLVDLAEPRWFFLNTLFSISTACTFMQLVDLLDSGQLPGCMGYGSLFTAVRRATDEAHMEGRLKAEILADPGQFVDIDEETPLALLDQKKAGKKLLMITNSGRSFSEPILNHAFDPFLPKSLRWRDLFDIIITRARKPEFFTLRMPAFEVTDSDGLLREHRGPLTADHIYLGANARLVEESLGLSGEEILYVGDHIYTDVNVSKSIARWRTALVVRELEVEIEAVDQFQPDQTELTKLMETKESIEQEYFSLRLSAQRAHQGYGPDGHRALSQLQRRISELHNSLLEIDSRISPIAQASNRLVNENWGLLMRTGIDKSHFARQIENYADVYTARVSNFLHVTPYAFLRSSRGSLPHDPECRAREES